MGSPFTRDTYTYTEYTTRAEARPGRLEVRAKAAAADAAASMRIDRVCEYIYTDFTPRTKNPGNWSKHVRTSRKNCYENCTVKASNQKGSGSPVGNRVYY